MAETIKIPQAVNLIAHRGLSCLKCENTLPAFEEACKRPYFGVECDVHCTRDGAFVIMHDDNTSRMCTAGLEIRRHTLQQLRALKFKNDPDGTLRIPTLEEYLTIVSASKKVAIIELKSAMHEAKIVEIMDICRRKYSLDSIIFISFHFKNLVTVRKIRPEQSVQLLAGEYKAGMEDKLQEYGFGTDIHYSFLNEQRVEEFHRRNIKVNCWTCDDPAIAARLVGWGVDYITTNILQTQIQR